MAVGFSNWFLILYLVLLTCSCGNGVKEINKQRLQEFHDHQDPVEKNIQLQGHSRDEHENHKHGADPSKLGMFTLNDLFPGKTMLLNFQKFKLDPSSSHPFLNREEADSIPLSLTQLPKLLEYFSISRGSPEAKSMENTLKICTDNRHIKGETKTCVTSLESMLDFVHGILGSETPIQVLTTQVTQLPKSSSSSLFQNYTILEAPKEVPSRKTAACHGFPYPYAVFGCHNFASENKVFRVSLGGEDGSSRVEAVSICHMDTTDWGADHVAFRMPGVKPGTPVCHFFVGNNLLWVSAPAAAATA